KAFLGQDLRPPQDAEPAAGHTDKDRRRDRLPSLPDSLHEKLPLPLWRRFPGASSPLVIQSKALIGKELLLRFASAFMNAWILLPEKHSPQESSRPGLPAVRSLAAPPTVL